MIDKAKLELKKGERFGPSPLEYVLKLERVAEAAEQMKANYGAAQLSPQMNEALRDLRSKTVCDTCGTEVAPSTDGGTPICKSCVGVSE